MLKKKWKFREEQDKQDVLALADSLNISTILAKLLLQRDVKNFFEAREYFRPSLDQLHDPYLMDGMDTAAKRVIEALSNREKIAVYGDYDVDGTCAAALMYLFLKELDADVQVYIPNRLTEGYGISEESIDILAGKGVGLMISVDCGITAVDEVAHAKTHGIDTIICDHHQPKDEIPDAVAVLDALKPGDTYPFKFLSGAGVAFKLARAVSDKIGKKDMILGYLDLVALAGAADIVPLLNENRILVRKGIEQINENPRPGIEALIKMARMTPGNLSAGQIVFTIAPRINAVGRLGDAERAVQLFVTNDKVEAERLAGVLESENLERRKIDEMTFSHAVEMVESQYDMNYDKGIVLHYDSWHPGVIGIVASRLVEKYYRPTVMLTTIDGVAKGSARSIHGFNIYQAIEECEDLLIQFGGHKAAAGLALEIENIPAFRERFNNILRERLTEEDVYPEVTIDAILHLSEITPKFVRILQQFAPFGPGNMRPVFLSQGVRLGSYPRIVGVNHIAATFKQNGSDKVFDSIGFNMGEYFDLLDAQKLFDIVFTIEKLVREGREYPQLRLKDIRIAD